eukprot:6188304-Pleurochrysis_carterae.AAC.1
MELRGTEARPATEARRKEGGRQSPAQRRGQKRTRAETSKLKVDNDDRDGREPAFYPLNAQHPKVAEARGGGGVKAP